jgi:hypothetical protein
MVDDEPTVIGITGMKRCGTTFQYNVCRLACELAGYGVWAGGPAPDAFEAMDGDQANVYVVKEHRWSPLLAKRSNYVFTASRDIDEVVESMKTFRGEPSEEDIEKWEKWLSRWRRCATWHQPYDYLVEWPGRCVQKHVDALGLSVNHIQIRERLAEEIQPPTEERQGEDSLVFEDHYQSNDPEELAERLSFSPEPVAS